MTEDLLVAAASLSLWFPPVRTEGDVYIDAIFNIATNLEEAIRRGADELWIIWTTSQRGQWMSGYVGAFFGIFEATTTGGYKNMLARIERNNKAVARGAGSEFGRHIKVCELKAEVPLHYLFNFSKKRTARRWMPALPRGVPGAKRTG